VKIKPEQKPKNGKELFLMFEKCSSRRVRDKEHFPQLKKCSFSIEQLKKDSRINEDAKLNSMHKFEDLCQQIRHKYCICCMVVSTNITIDSDGICTKCKKLKNVNYYLERKMLPVWRKKGVPQYHVPDVLACLTHAEKMLIQKVSPFVPLHHIKNGTMGIHGHVCAFEQDISEFMCRLPRKNDDVSVLRILKKVKEEIGSDNSIDKIFLVRKDKVLAALGFLKEYHSEYSDIVIDESNLDWIDGNEGVLEGQTIQSDEIQTQCDAQIESDDMGPSPSLTCKTNELGPSVSSFGYIDNGGKSALSDEDQGINNALQEAVENSKSKKDICIDWPAVKDSPINEYGDTKIFTQAFPWLFPGRFSDCDCERNIFILKKKVLFKNTSQI
jgi:hypothetical protein